MGRVTAIGALLVVIASGLVTRRFPIGNRLWDHHAGEVLYAAMVALVVIVARPSLRPRTVAAIAMALCTALEFFQATGIPARSHRLIRFVLGATFAWSERPPLLRGRRRGRSAVRARILSRRARTVTPQSNERPL